MIKSLSILMKHMEEEHPDSKIFGDSCCFDLNSNKVYSQKCFICGKELIEQEKPTTPLNERNHPMA